MILRRTALDGALAEPSTSKQSQNSAPAQRERKTPRFHVVLGRAPTCYPRRDTHNGPSADGDPATGLADAALAGRLALVVDDEPMILEILAEYCTSLRMEVCEAADGEGALKQIEARPGIDVLITDVRMPGLDGPALAEQALALRPGMKVIFVTGYTTHRSSVWPILRKPFDLSELEEALRRSLMHPDVTSE